ncbi:MAG: EAL domain-containing protein [Clostridia bacterium]|nr:EAL domain-containing protein [Clostridia bacterium]NCC67910.1 EAL domain-containing protein [Clostridia bacterium]
MALLYPKIAITGANFFEPFCATSILPKTILEVKEELFLAYNKDFMDQIAELRADGFKIAVDNISGNKGLLQALENTKVDIIKLEQEHMIESMDPDLRYNVLKDLIDFAKKSSIVIICTRIESDEQKMLVKKAGCSMAQGYLFAKPAMLDDFLK